MKRLLMFIGLLMSINASALEVSVWLTAKEWQSKYQDMSEAQLLEHKVFTHPCGTIQSIQVGSLPPPTSPEFVKGTEKAYEYDAAGNVLNAWSLPVDSYVYGISGDELIVSYSTGKALNISNTGKLGVSTFQKTSPKHKRCGALADTLFPQSAYVVCVDLSDEKSDRVRKIIYQYVCT